MNMFTARAVNFLGFWICCGLIAFAFYLQNVMSLQPCPLCILERGIVFMIGGILLMATIHNPGTRGEKIYGGIILLVALLGMIFAARHLWLQAQPHSFGEICVPGFSYLIKSLPLSEAIKMLFLGSADCAKVSWTFLGLSIPGWTFLFFDIFALLGLGLIRGFFRS